MCNCPVDAVLVINFLFNYFETYTAIAELKAVTAKDVPIQLESNELCKLSEILHKIYIRLPNAL